METPLSRARWLQETRKMRFEEAYTGWQEGHLTQEGAARLLGVCATAHSGGRLIGMRPTGWMG